MGMDVITNLPVMPAARSLRGTDSEGPRAQIGSARQGQEVVTLSRHQIVAQAGTAMLSQASRTPQSLVSLLD